MQTWEIVKLILRDNPGGKSPKQIASFLNVSLSTVYRFAEDPTSSGVAIPTDKITQLSVFTGDDRLIRHFANECGYYIVTIPEKRRRPIKHIVKSLIRTIKEFSDFTAASSKALEDGALTAPESSEIKRECDEAIEAILNFKTEACGGK